MGPHTDRKTRKKSITGASQSDSQQYPTGPSHDAPSLRAGSLAGTTIINVPSHADSTRNNTLNPRNASRSASIAIKTNTTNLDRGSFRSDSSHNRPILPKNPTDSAIGLNQDPDSSIGSSGSSDSSSDGHKCPMLTKAALGLVGNRKLRARSGSWETIMWSGSESTASPTPSETFYEHMRQEQCEKDKREQADHKAAKHLARGKSTNTLPSLERSENEDWFAPKHPPVNDLHPPILRQPMRRSSSQWMVAPPPPAQVMERISCREVSGNGASGQGSITPSQTSSYISHGDGHSSCSTLQQLVQTALHIDSDSSAYSQGDSGEDGSLRSSKNHDPAPPPTDGSSRIRSKQPHRPADLEYFFPDKYDAPDKK
ncbi:hypothetical protein GGR50DRAFT_387455 [Xylaria sp. CBS 124048]|nr:hypothetical protein GGR50DRAFT_387455 [Xylaria sp. CBS 124048]